MTTNKPSPFPRFSDYIDQRQRDAVLAEKEVRWLKTTLDDARMRLLEAQREARRWESAVETIEERLELVDAKANTMVKALAVSSIAKELQERKRLREKKEAALLGVPPEQRDDLR